MTSSVADGAPQRLMLTSLSDLSGKSQMVSQWRGKVLVMNFYASNGVQFVGIATDNISKVRDYAKKMRIGYVLLIGGIETMG